VNSISRNPTAKACYAAALSIALVWSAGCGHQAPPPASSTAGTPPAAAHQHTAPHGGTLVELGSEFAHVELVLDPDAGSLTAYVLDGEAEESVRLKQPSLTLALDAQGASPAQVVDLAARADILTGETVGDSSEFAATSPSWRGIRAIKGRIADITVKGQQFRDVQF
jgi:hypothetical protein